MTMDAAAISAPAPTPTADLPSSPAPAVVDTASSTPAPSSDARSAGEAQPEPTSLREFVEQQLQAKAPAPAPQAPEPQAAEPQQEPAAPTLSPEHAAMVDKAQRFDHFQGQLATHGLSEEQAAMGLRLASAIVQGGQSALEALQSMRPLIEQLEIAAGERLTDDLAAAVESGEITHERALELSRARAAAQQNELRLRSLTDQQTRQQQEAAYRETAQKCVAAATAWEQQKQATDPVIYRAVVPLLNQQLEAHFRLNGPPATEKDWVDLHEKFYRQLASLATAAKPPTPATPVPSSRPAVGRDPANLHEFVAQRLARQ